eukprot:scaffold15.g4294.t1
MEALRKAKIIPHLVDEVLENSAAELSGNMLTPGETRHAPDVRIKTTDSELFTLICSDPDPPDPANPSKREWLHWLVTNIECGDFKKGQEITAYMGPAPPVGTHRYVFMLFAQANNEKVQATDPVRGQAMGRAHFSTRRFAQEHSLGAPVSVKWFNAHK